MIIGHGTQQKNFIRLAVAGRLAHGYLFFGQMRVGKATFARALARYLETRVFDDVQGGRPLGDMLAIGAGETGSVGIDAVRLVRDFLRQMPLTSPRRTAIIEEGDLLTPEAQNALLKTLEEPPSRALLVIAARDPEGLLPTLRSRMQNVHFGPVPKKDIERWLEKSGASREAAEKWALMSGGSPGIARRGAFDERFGRYLDQAERYLRAGAGARPAFVKELVGGEEFDAELFLEALTLMLASRERRTGAAWHALMSLRHGMKYYNLNPRIQLMALRTE